MMGDVKRGGLNGVAYFGFDVWIKCSWSAFVLAACAWHKQATNTFESSL